MPKQNGRLNAEFELHASNSKAQISVNVDIILFDEDGIEYMYAPAFDLMGYGNSPAESEASFQLMLQEYFRYALNKKTLDKDLQKLGWEVVPGRKKSVHYQPPSISYLLQTNEQLTEVYDKHDFKKTRIPVTIPGSIAHA